MDFVIFESPSLPLHLSECSMCLVLWSCCIRSLSYTALTSYIYINEGQAIINEKFYYLIYVCIEKLYMWTGC